MANHWHGCNAGNQWSPFSIKRSTAGFRGRGKAPLAKAFRVKGRKPHRRLGMDCLFHHDLSGHFRMHRTIVGVNARCLKCERVFVVRIQRTRTKQLVIAGDCVGHVVLVHPGHLRAGGDGQVGGVKLKLSIVTSTEFVPPSLAIRLADDNNKHATVAISPGNILIFAFIVVFFFQTELHSKCTS
jgi:hypothetical protein